MKTREAGKFIGGPLKKDEEADCTKPAALTLALSHRERGSGGCNAGISAPPLLDGAYDYLLVFDSMSSRRSLSMPILLAIAMITLLVVLPSAGCW